ncbi:MAG: 50S ribosomal protein L30 [Gemmatimonadetes bacterium]|nr:50S ribosomal protein L30 [Gemmatimonadota bacterium]
MPSRTKAGKAGRAGKAKTPAKKRAAPRASVKESGGAKLVVKQVKSGIGHAETYKRTLRALGLRHHQAEIVVTDNPSIRGMLTKVHHLVSVRPQEA